MAFRSAAVLLAMGVSWPALAASQGDLDSLSRDMGVRLAILDNKPAACPKQVVGCFLSELSLKMPDSLTADLAGGDFKLYFSSVAPIIEAESDAFSVRLINGDVHVLEPRRGVRLQAGKTYVLKLWTQGHFFSAYYPMPNMYLTSGKLQPRAVAATKPVIDPETGLESVPHVAPMTDEAKLATASADDETRWMTAERTFAANAERTVAGGVSDVVIVPTPTLVQRPEGAAIDLTQGVRLQTSGISAEAIAVARAELARAGVRTGGVGPQLNVRVQAASGLKPEAYRLVAQGGAITIDAADAAGASYALHSLGQQAAHEGGRLRPIVIEDEPRFGFRGLHVDLARNFHSKQ